MVSERKTGIKLLAIGSACFTLFLMATLPGCGVKIKPEESRPFGYQAIKINGRFITPEVLAKEKNAFFLRWRRDGNMLRKSEEERTDLIVEETIKNILVDEHLENEATIAPSPAEVDYYIERYIKSRYATPEAPLEYMHHTGVENEDGLEKSIALYLRKLKHFPRIAREMGVTIPATELDSLYRNHVRESAPANAHPKDEFADMTLMARFGKSPEFTAWVDRLKSGVAIEILDPAMKAYRLSRDARYREAGVLYEQAFGIKKSEIFLQRAIECAIMDKNWDAAIRLCGTALKIYPDKLPYTLDKAEALYRKGKTREALKLFRHAEARSQESVYLKDLVMQKYKRLGLDQESAPGFPDTRQE